jgi:arylsulfatase A
LFLIALLGLSIPALPAQNTSTEDRPPNIILIMADDLGYETIGANGGTSYETPHLDRMASQGARFQHCYAQPLCTPSRVQIMTGKYNVRNYTRFRQLDREQTTFAHLLKDAGYATAIAGKWQLGQKPDSAQHFGFDESLLWQHTRRRTREGSSHDTRFENPRLERNGEELNYDEGQYGPDLVTDFVCDFMEDHQNQPFLVYYPMILTHCPFVPTPDSADWDPTSLGSEEYKGDAKYFGDMVTYMDKLVGRIAAKAEELGLAEDTIIMFTGDNGTDKPVVSMLNGREVAGAKGQTTDAGTRVPLIVYGPGHVEPRVITDLVDFSDFLPTLCNMAGVEVPKERLTLDGRSFYPQLQGKEGNPREWIYCWYSRGGNDKKAQVFARNQRYKLYRNGKFYDIEEDVTERSPLTEADLTAEQQQVKARLREVIDSYEQVRGAGEA